MQKKKKKKLSSLSRHCSTLVIHTDRTEVAQCHISVWLYTANQHRRNTPSRFPLNNGCIGENYQSMMSFADWRISREDEKCFNSTVIEVVHVTMLSSLLSGASGWEAGWQSFKVSKWFFMNKEFCVTPRRQDWQQGWPPPWSFWAVASPLGGGEVPKKFSFFVMETRSCKTTLANGLPLMETFLTCCGYSTLTWTGIAMLQIQS